MLSVSHLLANPKGFAFHTAKKKKWIDKNRKVVYERYIKCTISIKFFFADPEIV